jgi:hypothetical protein
MSADGAARRPYQIATAIVAVRKDSLQRMVRRPARHNGFLPEIILTNTITMAITRSTWIKPPIVCEETNPSSHRMISTIAIVYNITIPFFASVLGQET